MAVKDHSLDEKIVKAAFDEFMKYGFQKSSINKIAEIAGVTTGAIYTRYKNKDSLFGSMIENIMSIFQSRAMPVAEKYFKAEKSKKLCDFLAAMDFENQVYMDILFNYYEEGILLFCKSDGSSVEKTINEMIYHKGATTIAFFDKIAVKSFDHNAVHLLMNSQFYFYRQLLQTGYEKSAAIDCMSVIQEFSEAGWKHLFEQLQIE